MRAFWAVLCIASLTTACGDDDFMTGDGLPNFDAAPRPDAPEIDGGGEEADGGLPDAAPGPKIRGAICVVADIRAPASCGAIPQAGVIITVEGLEGFSTTTDSSGAFTLPPGTGAKYVTIVATDPNNVYHKGAVVFRPEDDGSGVNVKMPLVTKARMNELFAANGVTEDANDGQFVVLVRSGSEADGALVTQASLAPIGDALPYYDNVSANVFVQNGDTGARGFAVYFNAPPGASQVSITKGADTYPTDYIIVKGTVTFMSLAFYDAT